MHLMIHKLHLIIIITTATLKYIARHQRPDQSIFPSRANRRTQHKTRLQVQHKQHPDNIQTTSEDLYSKL